MAFLINNREREGLEEANDRRVCLSEKAISGGWRIRRTSEWVWGLAIAVGEAGLRVQSLG